MYETIDYCEGPRSSLFFLSAFQQYSIHSRLFCYKNSYLCCGFCICYKEIICLCFRPWVSPCFTTMIGLVLLLFSFLCFWLSIITKEPGGINIVLSTCWKYVFNGDGKIVFLCFLHDSRFCIYETIYSAVYHSLMPPSKL